MNTFIQYIYLWHPATLTGFLVAGIAGGMLLSLTHKKRRSSTVVWATLVWILIFYPLYMTFPYDRWQMNVNACQTHNDYHMIHGICYKPVNGYVPVSTWTINKPLENETTK